MEPVHREADDPRARGIELRNELLSEGRLPGSRAASDAEDRTAVLSERSGPTCELLKHSPMRSPCSRAGRRTGSRASGGARRPAPRLEPGAWPGLETAPGRPAHIASPCQEQAERSARATAGEVRLLDALFPLSL